MPSLTPQIRRLGAVALFLIGLWVVFELSGLRAAFSVQTLRDSVAMHPVGGLLIFAGLFSLGNLLQIPGSVFLVAAVLALGEWWGGLATYAAACISCVCTFVVIRAVGANALREFKHPRAQRLFAQLDAHPVRSVFLLRLLFQTVPAMNYALALSGLRLQDYLLGTLLGLPIPIGLYAVFLDTLAQWLHWPLP